MKSFEMVLFKLIGVIAILLVFITSGGYFAIWGAFSIFLTLLFVSAAFRYIIKQENSQSIGQEIILKNKAYTVAGIILSFPLILFSFGKETMDHSFIFVSIFLIIPLLIFGFCMLLASLFYKIGNKYSERIGKIFWMGLISVGIAIALFVEYLP